MGTLGPKALIILFAMQAAPLSAQGVHKPEPSFALSLFHLPHESGSDPKTEILIVRLTNISKQPIHDDLAVVCEGAYKLSVLYNGDPIGAPKFQECPFVVSGGMIDPGESVENEIPYNTAKPGTYQFILERKAFPQYPNDHSTVRSNALTTQVPDANAATDTGEIFSLNLSVGTDKVGYGPNFVELVVKRINMSKDDFILDDPCTSSERLYKIDVSIDGRPIQESDSARKGRENLENAEAKGGLCIGSNSGGRAAPGEFIEDRLYYEAKIKGNYEFTVERRTFPQDMTKSVTVKSNAVSIVMPDPDGTHP
jgi:hypothetical protein